MHSNVIQRMEWIWIRQANEYKLKTANIKEVSKATTIYRKFLRGKMKPLRFRVSGSNTFLIIFNVQISYQTTQKKYSEMCLDHTFSVTDTRKWRCFIFTSQKWSVNGFCSRRSKSSSDVSFRVFQCPNTTQYDT